MLQSTNQTVPDATGTGGEIIICSFANKQQQDNFNQGKSALTLCGEWVNPSSDEAVRPDYQDGQRRTMHCPRCMNIEWFAKDQEARHA